MKSPNRAWLNSAAAAALCLLCGGLSVRQRPPTPPLTPDAWLEAKPACVFPLTSATPPDSQDSFMTALLGGLTHLAIMPAGNSAVACEPIAFPAMKSLRIDLSNAVEDDTHKPPHVNWHYIPASGIHVGSLEVCARPLIIQGAKVQYDMTVTGADLKMAQDRKKNPLLMLMAADEGRFSILAARADVETICLAAAKTIAIKHGFAVKSLAMQLTTSTPRTIDANASITLDGKMGGTLYFTGRLSIADDLTATASHLSCHGSGIGGVMIASFLEPAMILYNGKTRMLLSFPFDGMRLRDVKVQMDTSLHIDAAFAKRV